VLGTKVWPGTGTTREQHTNRKLGKDIGGGGRSTLENWPKSGRPSLPPNGMNQTQCPMAPPNEESATGRSARPAREVDERRKGRKDLSGRWEKTETGKKLRIKPKVWDQHDHVHQDPQCQARRRFRPDNHTPSRRGFGGGSTREVKS